MGDVPTQPMLRTERLVLVPLAHEHLELEVELDSDPEVLRYLFGRVRSRSEVEHAHRGRLARARIVPGLGFWVGYVAEEFVGWWILAPDDEASWVARPGEGSLGYRLLRRWWRQGLASEGSRELLRHGFETVGLERIYAQTMAVNEGSRATMSAIGMTYARTFFEEFADPLPGTDQGEVEYDITRRQWELRRH